MLYGCLSYYNPPSFFDLTLRLADQVCDLVYAVDGRYRGFGLKTDSFVSNPEQREIADLYCEENFRPMIIWDTQIEKRTYLLSLPPKGENQWLFIFDSDELIWCDREVLRNWLHDFEGDVGWVAVRELNGHERYYPRLIRNNGTLKYPENHSKLHKDGQKLYRKEPNSDKDVAPASILHLQHLNNDIYSAQRVRWRVIRDRRRKFKLPW